MGRKKRESEPRPDPGPTARLLRKMIDDAGLTLEQVSESAGFTKQHLSAVLTRKDSDPHISTVQKILIALDLDFCDYEKERKKMKENQ